MKLSILSIKDKSKVASYLEMVKNDFIPELGSRINERSDVSSLDFYAKKILDLGVVVCCEVEDVMSGLVVIYVNDSKDKNAYIPLLSVRSNYSGKGIASKLINKAESIAVTNKMKRIKVKTWQSNAPAISLYTKLGYTKSFNDNDLIFIKYI